MTQAEKAQLRYIALLTQNQSVQGDMARTITSAANAMRVLKQQFQLLGREIGNIFIPMLMKVIPVAIAVVKVLNKVAKAIAAMFGFQLPDLNWDSINAGAGAVEGLTDDLDDATGSAKKLKRQLAVFDELNNSTSPTAGGSGGIGGVGGAGFELDLPEYDMLEGFTKGIDDLTDKIMKFFGLTEDATGKLSWSWKEMNEKAKALIITLGSLFALKGLIKLATTIKTLADGFGVVKSIATKFFGVFTGNEATGSVGLLTKISTGFSNIASTLGLTTGGLILVIAAIAAVVTTFVYAYKHNEKFRQSVKDLGTAFKELINTIKEKLKPLIEATTPIIEKLTSNITKGGKELVKIAYELIKLGLEQIIDGITFSLTIMKDLLNGDFKSAWQTFLNMLSNGWNNAKESVENMIPSIKELVLGIAENWNDVYSSITNTFSSLGNWFFSNVIQPIGNFFKTLTKPVINVFESIWNKVYEIWSEVSTWFNDNVVTPIKEIFEPLIQKIGEIFSTIWQIVVAIWGVGAKWLNENFVKPTLSFFVNLFNGTKSIFTDIWNAIVSIIGGIANWVNDNIIKPILGFVGAVYTNVFEIVHGIWNTITSVFGRIANWVKENVVNPISNFLTKAWEAVGTSISGILLGAINGVISRIESIMNWVIGKLNGFSEIINKIPGVYIPYISPLYLRRFAGGGFPASGEFFMARENGLPEMVGRIGNRTAVANNDQIVSGISQGVYNAMINAQAEQQTAGTNVYIGNREVYRSFTNGLRVEDNRLGRTTIRV